MTTVALAMPEPEESKFINFFMVDNKLIFLGENGGTPDVDIDSVKRKYGLDAK